MAVCGLNLGHFTNDAVPPAAWWVTQRPGCKRLLMVVWMLAAAALHAENRTLATVANGYDHGAP